jgi:hypothetical protein
VIDGQPATENPDTALADIGAFPTIAGLLQLPPPEGQECSPKPSSEHVVAPPFTFPPGVRNVQSVIRPYSTNLGDAYAFFIPFLQLAVE